MIVDIRKEQTKLESAYINEVAQVDKRLQAENGNETKMREIMTQFSNARADQMMKSWKKLSQFLLVKYIDGNIKKETNGKFEESPYRKGQCVFPEQPEYPQKWYEMIIKDHGDIIKVPTNNQ